MTRMIEIFVPPLVGVSTIVSVMLVEIWRSGLSSWSVIYDKVVSGYVQFAIMPTFALMLVVGVAAYFLNVHFKLKFPATLIVYALLYVVVLFPVCVGAGLIDLSLETRSLAAVALFILAGVLHLACIHLIRIAGEFSVR